MRPFYEVVPSALVYYDLPLTNEILTDAQALALDISLDEGFSWGGTIGFVVSESPVDRRDGEPLITISHWMRRAYEVVPSALVYLNPLSTSEILTNLRPFDHDISVEEGFS
jgi:hypothetical protein